MPGCTSSGSVVDGRQGMEATVTLTQKDIATLLGVTVQAVQLRAAKGQWPFTEETGRGRGGKIKRYPLHGLPTEIVMLYKRAEAAGQNGENSPSPLPSPVKGEGVKRGRAEGAKKALYIKDGNGVLRQAQDDKNGGNGGNSSSPLPSPLKGEGDMGGLSHKGRGGHLREGSDSSSGNGINGSDSILPLSFDGRVSPPSGGPVTGGASLPPHPSTGSGWQQEDEHSPSPLPRSTSSRHRSPVKGEGVERVKIVCEGLTDWQTRIAAARFDLVSAYIRDKARARRKNGCGVVKSCREFVEAYNADVILKELHAALGDVSWKTLEKWHLLLERNGFDMACLAPLHGQHRKGISKLTTTEMESLLRFALHPNRLRISQITRFAKKTLLSEGIESPASEATMRRALLTWRDRNYDRWVFFREGEKALADKVLPYIERDDTRLEVGDVLVADGHKLNFQVINPYTGKPGRATLLMFFDWASRYPAGWHIMFSENIQCVHAALRRAILALGKIPRAVLLDNGKAFKAKLFHHADLEQAGIQGLYARLGIQAHFAFPYNAKAKPVERFFGTFNELERMLPSYTGQSIEDKPAWMMRNEKLHGRMHDARVPELAEADAIIEKWCHGEYARRPHRGISGRTPESIWTAGKGPGIEEEGLRFLMMTQLIKKVGRNGVTLFGVNFYDEALYGYREQVLVRLDYHNMDRVFVYTADDSQLLCAAKAVKGMHPLAKLSGDPLDRETLREELKTQKRLKKSTEKEVREMAARIAPWSVSQRREEIEVPMTPAQIADIEAQAAATEVIHLDVEEKRPTIWGSEFEKFDYLITMSINGGALSDEEKDFLLTHKDIAPVRSIRAASSEWQQALAGMESAATQGGKDNEIRGV